MAPAQEYPFIFTAPMKKRLSRRALKMLDGAWRRFPELEGRKITVGYTAAHLGSAVVPRSRGDAAKLTIRLKVKNLTYHTIGHELTHLLQAVSRLGPERGGPQGNGRIPGGEKQCDIWTLARSGLFCDDAPTYIKLPRAVRKNWPDYARAVRRLAIAALAKRKSYRLYIRWLEARIKALARRPAAAREECGQLGLPF